MLPLIGQATTVYLVGVPLSGSLSTTAQDLTFTVQNLQVGDVCFLSPPAGNSQSTVNVRAAWCTTANILTVNVRADAATPTLAGTWNLLVFHPENKPLNTTVSG